MLPPILGLYEPPMYLVTHELGNQKLPSRHRAMCSALLAAHVCLWYSTNEPAKHTHISFNLRASCLQHLLVKTLGTLFLVLPGNLFKTKTVHLCRIINTFYSFPSYAHMLYVSLVVANAQLVYDL